MESLRKAPSQRLPAIMPCCRCASAERSWDRMAGKAYCPDCQEALVTGLADPFVARTEKRFCSICSRIGTVRFLTFPLHNPTPVEMDFCPEHLRALIGRRLSMAAVAQLRRGLGLIGMSINHVFLLHDAFYDEYGRALQPAAEPE